MGCQPAVCSFSLEALLELNPELSLADILALWQWAGPSVRVH